MKNKTYPPNCIVEGEDCQLVITITYNKYTILASNGICKT